MISSMHVVQSCALMRGIDAADIQPLLKCLSAGARTYDKGEFVLSEGERVRGMGLVLSGSVHVIKEDFWGNRAILTSIGPGGLFAEAFSCAGVEYLPVSVEAAEKAELLMLDAKKILNTCETPCGFHRTLIENLVRILAAKNVMLTEKIEHVSGKTTRDKLISYLSAQVRRAGANRFVIPFNRQQLADYLAVERSAMCAELSRMQRDGIIRYDKSMFELLKNDGER